MPRRKSSTSFGEPNANPSGPGRRKLPPLPYVAPPDDGAPQLLQDYRHVQLNDASHDETHGQMMARQFFNADIGKFSVALARMEKEMRESVLDGGGQSGPKKRDVGSEKALELIDRLLAKFEAAEAKRK